MHAHNEPHPFWQVFSAVVAGGAAALLGYRLTRAGGAARSHATTRSTRPVAISAPEPRNAALTYRPLGETGTPYPAWLRALKGKSGVYVIRETQRDGSSEIVYVGESHSGRVRHEVQEEPMT